MGAGPRPWASVGKSPPMTSGRSLPVSRPTTVHRSLSGEVVHPRSRGSTSPSPLQVSLGAVGAQRLGNVGRRPGRPRPGGREGLAYLERHATVARRGPDGEGRIETSGWWRPPSSTALSRPAIPSSTPTCWPPMWCSAPTAAGPLPMPAFCTSTPAPPASSTRRRSGPAWSRPSGSASVLSSVARPNSSRRIRLSCGASPVGGPRSRSTSRSGGRARGGQRSWPHWPPVTPSRATTTPERRLTFVPSGGARP